MVKRISLILITSLFIALLLPSVIEPYPCFQEPCTAGEIICYVEVEQCLEYREHPRVTDSAHPTYEGTVSIHLTAPDGWHKLEWYSDGRWWLVTDAAHPDGVALQSINGSVELIGSAGQDTDPTHYRLLTP